MTKESAGSEANILEQNVGSLIESGGERPQLGDAARTRIKAELVAKFAVATTTASAGNAKQRARMPMLAVGLGLAAAAGAAFVASRFIGGSAPVSINAGGATKLADGTTYIAEPGAKVSVLGPRKLRIEGAALLDVAPGQGTFVVETTRGRIEVLGTRFLVDGEADRTTAAVVRGEVKLATVGLAGSENAVVVHAGEQAVAEAGRPPVRGPAPRLSHLVSWAQQARRAEEHDVQPLHHGTLFARDPGVRSHPPWGEEYPLPIKELKLDVVVDDQVARVAIDQTFHNDANQDLEGVYRFAIPPDAALQRLAMYVDGHLEESAVVERMQARRIYEELVYRRVDPALLEWAGSGRLSLRVYPVPALQDKRLMLAYTQSLPKLYDDWTLTVPLPEVDQLVGHMDVAVRVKGCANCELTSTSHTINVERTGEDAIVHYDHTAEKLGDSFVLHVRDTRHQTTVTRHTDNGEQYMLVRAPVELGHAAKTYKPRTWVILDDVSASRDAQELRAQRDLVDAFVREVDENDKLAVIAFDVEARTLLSPTRAMDIDRRVLRKTLDGEGGVGATDFQAALDAATKLLATVDPDNAMIVYLGDGMITAGPRNLDALRAQLVGKAHFVGVGVGDGPDTQTLGNLAAATGGYAVTLDLADDLGWRAFDLVAALHTSRVTNLDAKLVDSTGALVPATNYLGAQQIADGEELELVTKLAGGNTPVAIELTGMLDGTAWKQRIALDAKSHDGGYLPRMWAQRHIAARLLAKHDAVATRPCVQSEKSPCPTDAEAREARDEQIRREVVALGKKYFLLSRHTSLLVLENDDMYKKYNVEKGAGDTWAQYAMPATIPVFKSSVPVVASNIASDAELVRAPLQVFYNPNYYWADQPIALGAFGAINRNDPFANDMQRWEGNRGAPMTITTMPTGASVTTETRDQLRIANNKEEDGRFDAKLEQQSEGNMRKVVSSAEINGTAAFQSIGHGAGGGGTKWQSWDDEFHIAIGGKGKSGYLANGQQLVLQRLSYPSDQMFDDVTGFVPAMFADAADALRTRLATTAGTHTIDDAARALLAEARRALPAGVYRWGEREIAVDAAHHLAWRTTTDAGLAETASYDGTTWTRRYAELGLDVTRPVTSDDIALGLAYLPVWIADPAHYAKYFDVTAKGRDVTLSTVVRGKTKVAFVMTFDDQSRLVRITADDKPLVEITWSSIGPVTANVAGDKVAVGYTGQAIGDAATWAHGASRPGVVVELPMHLVDYWTKLAAAATAGTPAWRRAERQLMAAAEAVQDRTATFNAYDALRQHGGVELGDLALGAGGVATATTDEQFATALAPFAQQPLARYLVAGRAYGKNQKPARMIPESRDGLVGGLWQLRQASALLAANDAKAAADVVATMAAPELRLVAAAAGTNHYEADADQLARMWDAAAVGTQTNVARAQAAQVLFNRGKYDAGADRLAALVDQLDLDAEPPQIANMQYVFNSARRGQAGWEMIYASWRNKVLAGASYAHVMALLPAAQAHGDIMTVLARASALAGTDAQQQLAVASAALAYGQAAYAETLVKPILAKAPSRGLYQIAATIAMSGNHLAEALADLEAAQDAGSDEAVDINMVRGELGQLIGVAQRLAVQSAGAERQRAVQRAMYWGGRWRAVDPGNTAIDQQLGEMLLATGDNAGAWRQLSSTIERDPWSGAGYMTVAEAFERQGKAADALPFWQQAIVIDQTNPTPRLRKAQALIALGRTAEGDQLLHDITSQKWHDIWSGVVGQAVALEQQKQRKH